MKKNKYIYTSQQKMANCNFLLLLQIFNLNSNSKLVETC